ncbi:hypothetical protein KJE20_03984 [Pyrenophora tritici-repentis]|nr:hypothetical protein KJE20_03984 [Pyrenophora tritici-repentis]
MPKRHTTEDDNAPTGKRFKTAMSDTQEIPLQPNSPFLSLAGEIRNIIYAYCVDNNRPTSCEYQVTNMTADRMEHVPTTRLRSGIQYPHVYWIDTGFKADT